MKNNLKHISLRSLLLLVTLSLNSCVNSQPRLSKDFQGNAIYSDHYFKIILSHDSCSSFHLTQQWNFQNQYIIVETFDPVDSVMSKSIPIKFIKKDSLIFIVSIVSNNRTDTIKQFKLSKTDTLESVSDFRITNSENTINEESIYLGDTILTIRGIMYDCYRFESFKYWMKTFPGPSHSKKITYIDKKTLIPIQEDYLSFFMKHFCLPTKEWVMTRQVKLHELNNK